MGQRPPVGVCTPTLDDALRDSMENSIAKERTRAREQTRARFVERMRMSGRLAAEGAPAGRNLRRGGTKDDVFVDGRNISSPTKTAQRPSQGGQMAPDDDPFLRVMAGGMRKSSGGGGSGGAQCGPQCGRSSGSVVDELRATPPNQPRGTPPTQPRTSAAAGAAAAGTTGAGAAAAGAAQPPRRRPSEEAANGGGRPGGSGDGGAPSSPSKAASRVREVSRKAREAAERVGSKAALRRAASESSEKVAERKLRKKAEAMSGVNTWVAAHRTIYDQLDSLPLIGPPLFPEGWTAGEVRKGNVKSLRKGYHRAAARLHPDKVQEQPLSVQAVAEELFKALGESYQKELTRLDAGGDLAA